MLTINIQYLYLLQGVQLDEPCSPVAKQPDHDEVVTMRHGVTISRVRNSKSPEPTSMVRSPHCCSKMSSGTNGCNHGNVTSDNDIKLLANETRSLRLCKGKSDSKLCDRTSLDELKSRSVNLNYRLKGSRTSNLEEDEGLGIRDSYSDIHRGDYSYIDSVNNDSDSTEQSSETDHESTPRFSLTGESLSIKPENAETVKKSKTGKSDKYSKKRKFRKLLPALRRSQSVGCEKDLVSGHNKYLETSSTATESNKVMSISNN